MKHPDRSIVNIEIGVVDSEIVTVYERPRSILFLTVDDIVTRDPWINHYGVQTNW